MNRAAYVQLLGRAFDTPLPWTMRSDHRVCVKLVLVCLAFHADPDGSNAFPSRARIARQCHLSVRTVSRIVRELRGAGLIVEQVPDWTRRRSRTWRLQLAGGDGTDRMTRATQLSFESYDLSHYQVQEQVQELEERAAPLRGAPLTPDELTALRADADGNYRVILRLVHLTLDAIGASASLGDIVEAVKEQCAQAHIRYWPGDVVHRAVTAALVQRVRPGEPLKAAIASSRAKASA